MRKFLKMLDARRTASNLFVLLVAIAFYMLLANLTQVRSAIGNIYSYFAPFVAGVILAYMLHPLASFFSKRVFVRLKHSKTAWTLSVICTVVIALAIVGLLLWAIIPELIISVRTLISERDSYLTSLENTVDRIIAFLPFIDIDVNELIGMWGTMFDRFAEWLINNFNEILNTSYKVGRGLIDAIIAFVLSIYILADYSNLSRALKRFCMAMFKPSIYNRIAIIARNSNGILKGYLGGNLIDSIIVGLLNFIFMLICGMPSAGLISIIVGVTNFIPTFGPFIGAIPATLIILIFDPPAALWFVIFTIILQQIDANIIKPVLFGDTTGIAPIWVLVSIIVFGRMFGLIGMLFGVPIFAILKLIYDDFIAQFISARGLTDIPAPVQDSSRRPSLFARLFRSKLEHIPFFNRRDIQSDDDDDSGDNDDAASANE